MPLPKPWCLNKPRKLTDREASELVKGAFELCDLSFNSLDKMVEENIKRNRMTETRLEIYDKDGNEVTDADIHIELKNHEFKFGCNAFLAGDFKSDEKNAEYERIFTEVFNQAVIPFYWKEDEPIRGEWRFDKASPYIYRRPPADYMLEFCEKTGCQPKGHNLIWSSMGGLPKWLVAENDKRQAGIDIEKRFRILSERYAEKIPVWDVTNEFAGANFCDEFLPDDTLIRAWQLANELFHNNHLIINDYQCLFNDHYKGKMSALYQQVKRIEENGLRVDGVGMQCHLFHNENELLTDEPQKITAEYMIKMINTYSTLGKDIHLSEITIPSYDGRDEYLELQNIITENMYKLWFSMENVKSIVWWNLVDNTAIKASPNAPFDENYFGGGLLKGDFTKKPAYYTVENLIKKEWHTSVDTKTNQKGYASFCGFNGDYEITIKKGADETKKKIKVSKENPLITIKLD